MAKLYMIEDQKTGMVLNGYTHKGEPRFIRLNDEKRCVLHTNKNEAESDVEALINSGVDAVLITLTY